MGEGPAVVWNPWIRQTRYIDPKIKVNQPSLIFAGIGYDNNRRVGEIVFKALSVYKDLASTNEWIIHDLASDACKDKENYRILSTNITQGQRRIKVDETKSVSLNGTLYWVACYDKTHPFLFYIVCFNFSSEKCYRFCDIPCGKNHQRDALVLRVFGEDRFSLLNQCHVTKKINIWVTENKVGNNLYGQNIKWMKFMEASIPDLPSLVQTKSYAEPSYFIDGKKLVMCSCDETGRAWIYVVEGNKLISKKQLDSVVEPWPLHSTYFPSLVLVPGGQREEDSKPQVKIFVWLSSLFASCCLLSN